MLPPAPPPEPLLLRERLFEGAVRAAVPLARLAAPLSPKLSRGVAGRTGLGGRLAAWAAAERDPARPLAWLHAPSLGEGLMAQAIIEALRRARPEAQVLFTHFSPSAERLRGRLAADAFDYLPWDARGYLRPVLEAVRPDVVALVRTDLWPVLTAEAVRVGARIALVNAVLGAGSGRTRPAARALLRPALQRLSAVGAVAEEDAGRFTGLGVASSRVRVTGDARFDQVAARVAALDPAAPLLRGLGGGPPVLVAGSTWEADETRLVAALAPLLREGRMRLVAAPHEPSARHLADLERRLADAGVSSQRLATVEASGAVDAAAVLVDRVGVLADLYAAAAVAYVGGGFHAAGLHSVVEPAALGVPVLFGPRLGNAREAAALAAEGGGARVEDGEAVGREARRLLADEPARLRAGEAAAAFVERRRGGAAANAALVAELLER